MKIQKTYIKFVFTLAALLTTACSKEEHTPLQHTAQSTIATQEVTLALSAQLSNDVELSALEKSNARALENKMLFKAKKLRPVISGGKIKVVVVIGSTTVNQNSHSEELDWDYNPETGYATYVGKLTLPKSFMTAEARRGLKMMLVAAPSGCYNKSSNSLNFGDRLAEMSSNTDGAELPFAIPYFSEWMDLSSADISNDSFIDTSKKNIVLKPQGNIIRIEVQDQTANDRWKLQLKGLRFESNIMSLRGAYNLSFSPQTVGTSPVYTPSTEEQSLYTKYQNRGVGSSFASVYYHSKAVEQKAFRNKRTFYLWVKARTNVENPYLRSYLELVVPEPPISDWGWWNGKNGKVIVAGYAQTNLSRNGVLRLNCTDERKIFSPITRFAHSVASRTFDINGSLPVDEDNWTLAGVTQNKYYPFLTTAHSLYSLRYLQNKGFLGNRTRQAIRFPSFSRTSGGSHDWRIPSGDELSALIPAMTLNNNRAFAFLNAKNNKGQKHTSANKETVKLWHNEAASSYKGSYINMGEQQGEKAMMARTWALRLYDSEQHRNRWKTFYQYRMLDNDQTEPSLAAIQIQTYYLGEYFPDIKNIEDLERYGAALIEMITPEERNVPIIRRFYSSPRGQGQSMWGQDIWLSDSRSFCCDWDTGTFRFRTHDLRNSPQLGNGRTRETQDLYSRERCQVLTLRDIF